MRRLSLCLVVAAGCGRIGFDAASDARRDSVQGLALPTEPFGPPQLVVGVNDAATSDDDPSLTGDLLEIFFDADRVNPGGDIFHATRTALDQPWSAPTMVTELSLAGDDEDSPAVTSDGLFITFTSTRLGTLGADDLWFSTRPDRTSPWAAPTHLSEISTDQSEDRLGIADDRVTGVVGVKVIATGLADLYTTRRDSTAEPWHPPVAAAFNTAAYDGDGNLDASGRVLVFSSDRAGGGTNGDLYMATRASVDDPFGDPVPITELNTGGSDTDPWISPDYRTIYFTRGAAQSRELYYATR